MAEIDDEVLAFAMAMGRNFQLSEPRSKSAGKPKRRGLDVKVVTSPDAHANPTGFVAHLVASLIPDRRTSIKKSAWIPGVFDWVVAGGPPGLGVRFEGSSEADVRAKIAESATVKPEPGLDPVAAAIDRMRKTKAIKDRAVVDSRIAKRAWPPEKGSQAELILRLANAGRAFHQSRILNTYSGWTCPKPTTPAAFLKKLKDASLTVASFELHKHDSPTGIDWGLRAGQRHASVRFCAIDDASGKAISEYEFVVDVGKGAA
jgi:hypothetical protein